MEMDEDIQRGFDADDPSDQEVYVVPLSKLTDEDLEDLCRRADAAARIVCDGVDSVVFSTASQSVKSLYGRRGRKIDG